ncbi:MAG: AmmeMemoRadiSam system protein B [Candidatus Bipolaricaulota bacterium]|nr:AmmeMemoRadiSam system protein B [Candidatus Bipolaricaulota bacterium]
MGRRWPCAAGTFYPADPRRLRDEVEAALGGDGPVVPRPEPLTGPVGAILPHAGYRYSGAVAGAGFRALAALGRPEALVILGTNHTGLGGPITVGEPGTWETPLGEIPVPADLSRDVAQALGAERDDAPFGDEHSVEVQLPFVGYLFGTVPLVPVVVQHLGQAAAVAAGSALGSLLTDRPIALLASSDFTHYEPDPVAREKDRRALAPILNLDVGGFLAAVARYRVSICGVGAIALFLAAAREAGLLGAELLAYRTSGEVAGHLDQVVGYAAVLCRQVDDVA